MDLELDRLNLVVSIACFVFGLMSTTLIWFLWVKDESRSWLLLTLLVASASDLVAGLLVGSIAYIRATGTVPFPGPVTTLAMVLIFLQPAWLAVQFIRHGLAKRP